MRVQFGLDKNENHVLDFEEIDLSKMVEQCHSKMVNGAMVKTHVSYLDVMYTGPDCTNGGREIKLFFDSDDDRVFDAGEEIIRTVHECNDPGYVMLASVRSADRQWCYGMHVRKATNVLIENVTVEDFWGYGMLMVASQKVVARAPLLRIATNHLPQRGTLRISVMPAKAGIQAARKKPGFRLAPE